eukprot:1161330-Pelagomonas_calceolata.AAC.7
MAWCEHVNESALCFSACAYPNQDANTIGTERVHHEQKRVRHEQMEEDTCFSSIGILASLDDINYWIPLDDSQVGNRELEAQAQGYILKERKRDLRLPFGREH